MKKSIPLNILIGALIHRCLDWSVVSPSLFCLVDSILNVNFMCSVSNIEVNVNLTLFDTPRKNRMKLAIIYLQCCNECHLLYVFSSKIPNIHANTSLYKSRMRNIPQIVFMIGMGFHALCHKRVGEQQ